MVRGIYCHPGDDGIALPRCKAEVERPNQTLAGIAHGVQVRLTGHARAVVDELFIVWNLADVVDERAVELQEETLLFWSEVLPLDIGLVVSHGGGRCVVVVIEKVIEIMKTSVIQSRVVFV